MISPGLAAWSTSGPSPHFSSVPGLKFSIRISAVAISRRTSAWPSGTRRLAETDFLLRAITSQLTLSVPRPQLRIGSPAPGGSTLMTSAPMSPSNWPQNGPASSWPSSTTRRPARAPRFSTPILSTVYSAPSRIYQTGWTGAGRPVSASQLARSVAMSGPKLNSGSSAGRAARIVARRASVAAASTRPASSATTP